MLSACLGATSGAEKSAPSADVGIASLAERSVSAPALRRVPRHSVRANGLLPSPHRIGGRSEWEMEMAKFYCLIAALVVFAPMALATLNQAAQIVA